MQALVKAALHTGYMPVDIAMSHRNGRTDSTLTTLGVILELNVIYYASDSRSTKYEVKNLCSLL